VGAFNIRTQQSHRIFLNVLSSSTFKFFQTNLSIGKYCWIFTIGYPTLPDNFTRADSSGAGKSRWNFFGDSEPYPSFQELINFGAGVIVRERRKSVHGGFRQPPCVKTSKKYPSPSRANSKNLNCEEYNSPMGLKSGFQRQEISPTRNLMLPVGRLLFRIGLLQQYSH